jgi:hypothetical protein
LQGDSREDLTPCRPTRGIFSFERRCADSALQSWYVDSFPGFIDSCGRLILDEAGNSGVEGLILSGSFAAREGSVVMLGGGPVFLSDIDMLLVASSPDSHAELYRRRAAIGKACEELLPGARFEGSVDIGVMAVEELGRMPSSPGVFDMRERGVPLNGGDEILNRLPSFTADEIGAAEAVRLLENRMAAFLGNRPVTDRPEGVALFRFLYGLSRVYTDIITASLCAEKMYLPGYGARAEFITTSADAAKVRERLGGSLITDAAKWTDFKVDPDAGKVWKDENSALHIWLEAAGDLLAVRDRISRDEDAPSESRRGYRDILRSWRNIADEAGIAGKLRLFSSALVSGLDPGEHIREESVRLVRQAAEKGTECVAAGAPGGYPHGRTSWEQAAAETSSAWRRLVSGRDSDTVE